VQGGTGPIQVLLITKDHPFDRGPFFDMFDSFGSVITWTHVEQPAAEAFFDPKLAEPYDVFVFYDRAGRGQRRKPDGTTEVYFLEPSPELKRNTKALFQSGNKGFVFFHHSIASWSHNWPQYQEMLGGSADWGDAFSARGKEYLTGSGAQAGVHQHITVVDKTHPVVQGIGDGYDIVDETYLCPMFEDSVHCLLRTDFVPIETNFPARYARGFRHPPGSNMAGWVKTAENSPIVYLQNGHGPDAWSNPAFQRLMTNAIQWVNSPEAKQWAKANSKKIFS
jgi:type 1 glutamine amidotransferase